MTESKPGIRFARAVLVSVVVLLIVAAISPGIGSTSVSITDAWRSLTDTDSATYVIAWKLRFPRALKALVAGATFALCGAVFQTLFRNPLATPHTFGIASGASLGALIAIKLNWTFAVFGLSSISIASFGGSLAVMLAIFALARSKARISGNTLLLAGVTIGFFCSGMMMFVTWLADVTQVHQTVRWMMGDLETYGGVELAALLPIVVPTWIIILLYARGLNQFDVGAEIAATRGVNVARMETLVILAGCLAVAAVASMCGPIGFVGLIIPQLLRLLVGCDHRILLPVALINGATFLLLCDYLTTLIPKWYALVSGRETTASQIPIGVMTALIGTPVFLVLLTRRSK